MKKMIKIGGSDADKLKNAVEKLTTTGYPINELKALTAFLTAVCKTSDIE